MLQPVLNTPQEHTRNALPQQQQLVMFELEKVFISVCVPCP